MRLAVVLLSLMIYAWKKYPFVLDCLGLLTHKHPELERKENTSTTNPLVNRTLTVCIWTINFEMIFHPAKKGDNNVLIVEAKKECRNYFEGMDMKEVMTPFRRFYGTSEFYVLMCRMWLWSSSTKFLDLILLTNTIYYMIYNMKHMKLEIRYRLP